MDFLSYGDVLLHRKEAEFLIELEELLNCPIPDISRNSLATFGYIHRSYSVIELRLFRAFFDGSQQIQYLPETINHLINLETIDLSHNLLDHLPESFAELKELENLYLDFNLFEIFPSQILELHNLRKLNLNDNLLLSIAHDFTSLPYLESIMLAGNLLTDLPQQLGNLRYLKRLDLTRNRLKEVTTSDIEALKHLYSLDIRDNMLTEKTASRLSRYLRLIGLSKRKFHFNGKIHEIDDPYSLRNLHKRLKSDFRNIDVDEKWLMQEAELKHQLYSKRHSKFP